jgi:hypothetical protein
MSIEVHDDVGKIVDYDRGEPSRWLIKKQNARVTHKSSCNGKHLLLAATEGACKLAGTFLKAWEKPKNSSKAIAELGVITDVVRT